MDQPLKCPKCSETYGPNDYFYSDHKYDLEQYGMCFHCCRWYLGHAGYGE